MFKYYSWIQIFITCEHTHMIKSLSSSQWIYTHSVNVSASNTNNGRYYLFWSKMYSLTLTLIAGTAGRFDCILSSACSAVSPSTNNNLIDVKAFKSLCASRTSRTLIISMSVMSSSRQLRHHLLLPYHDWFPALMPLFVSVKKEVNMCKRL